MRDYSARYRFLDSIVNLNAFGTQKLARYLSYLIIPKPAGVETIHTLLDFDITVDPLNDTNGIEHELYYKGVYEKETMHMVKAFLKPGDTFIDVGANIGIMTLYASICVGPSGNVWAVEANPATVKLLKDNIALNNFNNIKILEFALGAQEGKGEIYPETIEGNRGAASMVKRDGQGTLKYDIIIKKLDDVIGGVKPTLMKIDVEGWELEVLKGSSNILSASDAPVLIVECFLDRENTIGSPTEIYKHLKSVNDYVIYKSQLGKGRISGLVEVKSAEELPNEDNIICVPRSKLSSIPKSILA